LAQLTYEIIGRRLQSARKKAGFTQEQVANYLKVPREYMSYYETGSRAVDMLTIDRLADLYGYDIAYFLDPEEIDDFQAASAAFRLTEKPTEKLSPQTLEVVARARRIAINMSKLNKLLEV